MREHFESPLLVVDASTTAEQVEGWDSVAHVGLIVAVEKAFGVRFTTKEVKSLDTVGDLLALLERRSA
ncbi:MAG TPA: acyl carrier protein [Steroidobacteraceae bacterium]|nr:acyl carrier protein [Steroidobacteraceae bacterium]